MAKIRKTLENVDAQVKQADTGRKAADEYWYFMVRLVDGRTSCGVKYVTLYTDDGARDVEMKDIEKYDGRIKIYIQNYKDKIWHYGKYVDTLEISVSTLSELIKQLMYDDDAVIKQYPDINLVERLEEEVTKRDADNKKALEKVDEIIKNVPDDQKDFFESFKATFSMLM